MNILRRTIGTAGHVDHGKTALVRALTGVDCDTHPAEKQRGLTINLGHAPLHTPVGLCAVVDAPGHADFLDTMAAGAGGVDLALLVVAANEGVAPQTREHIEVLRVLHTPRIMIALNKCDLADADLLCQREGELRALLAETPYAEAQIIPVSARTGSGLEEIRRAIGEELAAMGPRPAWGRFRMPVDHLFSVEGRGTVVTGGVEDGVWRAGEDLWLSPGGQKLRVRRAEIFGEETQEVFAGQRVAFNLAGLHAEQLPPGAAVSAEPFAGSTLLDARIELTANATLKTVWSQMMFLTGMARMQAGLQLLDCDAVTSGEAALAQITLPSPICALPGDRFLLRDSSDRITLGGGVVLDAQPQSHRRRRVRQIEQVKQLATGGLLAAIRHELTRNGALTVAELALRLRCEDTAVREAVAQADDIHLDGDALTVVAENDAACEEQLAVLLAWIERENRNIRVKSGLLRDMAEHGVDGQRLHELLRELEQRGEIVRLDDQWLPFSLVADAAEDLRQRFNRSAEPVKLGEAKRLFGCARDTALALLEYLDACGFTRNNGNLRTAGDLSADLSPEKTSRKA